MSFYLGIDLGTSGVKVVVVDEQQTIVEQESAPLTVERPHPLWVEQDPEAWWLATERALAVLRGRSPRLLSGTRAIGLSGQMHGATLLDSADRVLRPAMLWNDGRSAPQCAEITRRVPRFSQAYSPAPTCSPTRHAIQFGRSPTSLNIFGADGIRNWDADTQTPAATRNHTQSDAEAPVLFSRNDSQIEPYATTRRSVVRT